MTCRASRSRRTVIQVNCRLRPNWTRNVNNYSLLWNLDLCASMDYGTSWRCDMRQSRIIAYYRLQIITKTKHFCWWNVFDDMQNGPLIILVLIWRKSIRFWRKYARKTIFNPMRFLMRKAFHHERVEYKLLSLTYKVLTTSKPDYL